MHTIKSQGLDQFTAKSPRTAKVAKELEDFSTKSESSITHSLKKLLATLAVLGDLAVN